MKVAMLGWEFPPFMAGGLGIHCLELTTQLAGLGVELDFYMPHIASVEGPLRVADHHKHLRILEVEADAGLSPYGTNEPTPHGKRTAYERNFNAAVALYNARLVEAFDSWDADVLHCHDWITVPAALELRRRTGLPLVFTVHSTEFDRSADFMPQTWIEEIERKGVHGADHVIAVSQYTKDLLGRLYEAPTSRITAVHNGVDLSKFNAPQERDYTSPRGSVLFLSRLSRQKGPLHFLRAARRVVESRPETQFIMAGTGELLAECIQFTVEHGLTRNVRFAGFVPMAHLADFYGHSEVYVLPSVSEPFGISILEAMATGLPTVVSKTTGVGEALRNVLKADYWDADEMADMILRLLDSTVLREELGRNGAREAHRFTWELCAKRTLDVYGRAAADSRKSDLGRETPRRPNRPVRRDSLSPALPKLLVPT